MPPAGLWSDKTAEDSGCGCLRRGPAVPVDLTALGSGRPGPPGGLRTSRFRTRPSGLMAGGPLFFDPPPRPSVASKAGFLVLFRGPQSLSAAVGMPSESVGNGDSRSPANIATPRRHPVWARHTPSGHRETTFCDCHSHGRPSTSSPPNGLHSSAWQLFSDTIPTLQSTSPKAEKTCFPSCFSGSQQPWKDICPAFRVVSHNSGFADPLVSSPFFLSSMRRRKRGKDLGRSGEWIGGGFCARRVGYSRGFPWPGSRAARRFVRRGPT